MFFPGSIGIFDRHTQEGLDFILLRKRRTSFGGNRNRPGGKCRPLTNHVVPYIAPNTMRRKKVKQ